MLPSKSTKNTAPTIGVDKNMLVRKILHVLKDNDLSLNIWFRKRDMGYAKILWKKIGHMKIQCTKRKKNDEHLKAHVLEKRGRRKKDSHVS